MKTFYATPKFPMSDCSYDGQIWPFYFALCLMHLFFPPCTYPSTRPHIQESDVQVKCRLNFVIIISLFVYSHCEVLDYNTFTTAFSIRSLNEIHFWGISNEPPSNKDSVSTIIKLQCLPSP